MALSRLRVTFRSFALNYLDPTGAIREEPNENLLTDPHNSIGITKAYTHNKAFSVFLENAGLGQHTFNGLALYIRRCSKGDFRYVRHNDTDHENYHQTNADYDERHIHILKNHKKPHPMLTANDLQCILNGLKEHEKIIGFCQDGQTQCLLSDADQQKILDGYEKYLRQKKAAPQLQAAVDQLSHELENRCIAGAKTFTQAFLTTFLERYIKPYLIGKLHCPNATRWGIEMIKSGITFSLNQSLLNTALDAVIRNGLKTGLEQIGINPDVVNKLTTEIGSIIAFTQNPLSLIELGINGSAAAVGQTAAYQLIRLLPKLKYEPAPTESVTTRVIEDKPTNIPPSLHRRR